ncbi:LPXTG cell wall anchor domain-containing protein [Micromonospora sp. NPDC049301]
MPVTGTSAGSLLSTAILGLGAVALGAAFIAVRRRRDAEG